MFYIYLVLIISVYHLYLEAIVKLKQNKMSKKST